MGITFGSDVIGFEKSVMATEAQNISNNVDKFTLSRTDFTEDIDVLKDDWEGDLGTAFTTYANRVYAVLECANTTSNTFKDNQVNYLTDFNLFDGNICVD